MSDPAADSPPSDSTSTEPPADASATISTGDRLLLIAFWAWAGLLVVATIAQLAGWQGVLDLLDVKRWFAR